MRSKLALPLVVAAGLGLSACSNPYDPGQRAVGGGLLGAGTGAAIGGLVGGGRGAAAGALLGGGVGAVGGAATAPNRPAQQGYYPPAGYGGGGYGQPVYQQAPPAYYQPRPY